MRKRVFSLGRRVLRQRFGALPCVLLLAALSPAVPAADWEPLPPLPEPNGGFVCGVAKGKIVVAGGTNWVGGKKKWLKSIHVFDPSSKQWGTAHDLESALAYAAVFHDKDAFAFLGGFDAAGPSQRFGWGNTDQIKLHYDYDQPQSLVLAAGGAVGDLLIVSGGTNDPASLAGLTRFTYSFKWGKVSPLLGVTYADLGLSPSIFPFGRSGSFKITRLADYPGKPFAVAASAVAGDELFVFGGMNYDEATKGPMNSKEAYAFSPAKNAWRRLQPLAVANRGLTAVVLDEQRIYLAGGYTDNFTADAVIYDVKTDSYGKARSLPYAAMVGLVKLGDSVYCLGGEDKQKSRTDKFFRIPVGQLK